MLEFERPKLQYKPKDINHKDIPKADGPTTDQETVDVTEKLLRHLEMIQEYRDRIEAVDYLIDNAEKMSGNLKYDVKDESLQRAIKSVGGSGEYVDFTIFKKAVALLKQSYEEIALVEFTGARDES